MKSTTLEPRTLMPTNLTVYGHVSYFSFFLFIPLCNLKFIYLFNSASYFTVFDACIFQVYIFLCMYLKIDQQLESTIRILRQQNVGIVIRDEAYMHRTLQEVSKKLLIIHFNEWLEKKNVVSVS